MTAAEALLVDPATRPGMESAPEMDVAVAAAPTTGPGAPAPDGVAKAADNRERRFDIDELFFSRTDRKGIIRSGNEVFVRVSGYPRDELVGQAHNMVRHPDMPRALFRVFWERLQAGAGVTAYVKNRAEDGSYYWVLATADAVGDGFVSVRTKPASPLFATAKAMYADVLAVEKQVEGGDVRRRKAAIDAGVERLNELLAAAGYEDYHAFIRAALPAEDDARQALLGASVRERLGTPPPGADRALAGVLAACCGTQEVLDDVASKLEGYAVMHDTLAPKSAYVNELADNIRLFSLNALLGATRLGSRGAALGAVAEIMRARSHTAGPVTDALGADIASAVNVLEALDYRVALSRLQSEMMMVFVRELISRADRDGDAATDLQVLASGLDAGVRRLAASLEELGRYLKGITHHAGRLRSELNLLSRLEVNGRIEAARLTDAGSVLDLFETIGRQVTTAHEQLADFKTDSARAAEEDALNERMLDRLTLLEERLTQLIA